MCCESARCRRIATTTKTTAEIISALYDSRLANAYDFSVLVSPAMGQVEEPRDGTIKAHMMINNTAY